MRWPWRRKPKPPARHPLPGWPAASGHPDSLAGDLRAHLYASMYAVLPRERQQAHWVMTLDWLNECRKLDTAPTGLLAWPGSLPGLDKTVLLGRPVEVREGSGPPHLEPRTP